MGNPYPRYPHQRARDRFLLFVPLDNDANDPDIPLIFKAITDVNLNCGHCGRTLIAYQVGERMKAKDAVLDEKERILQCPHCEKAAQKKAAQQKSPRSRPAKRKTAKSSKGGAPKK